MSICYECGNSEYHEKDNFVIEFLLIEDEILDKFILTKNNILNYKLKYRL
jgi:hypothetical protein